MKFAADFHCAFHYYSTLSHFSSLKMFMKEPPYTRTQQVAPHAIIANKTARRHTCPHVVLQELVLVLRRMAAENKIDLDLPNIHLKH
jgi:hypothetical protein